jgi:hypothetical protein
MRMALGHTQGHPREVGSPSLRRRKHPSCVVAATVAATVSTRLERVAVVYGAPGKALPWLTPLADLDEAAHTSVG